MSEDNDKFEKIIKESGLEKIFENIHPSILTLGDLYEGIALMSDVQVDVHDYLRSVIRTIQSNHRSPLEEDDKIPQLTPNQATALTNIFYWTALFLEEPEV